MSHEIAIELFAGVAIFIISVAILIAALRISGYRARMTMVIFYVLWIATFCLIALPTYMFKWNNDYWMALLVYFGFASIYVLVALTILIPVAHLAVVLGVKRIKPDEEEMKENNQEEIEQR